MKLKYTRPTREKVGHTKIIVNGEEAGFLMPIKYYLRPKGKNWIATLYCKFAPPGKHILYGSNRNDIVQQVKTIFQ